MPSGPYVFLAEDDFLYREDVNLGQLVDVLEARPQVTQVALLREPAYQSEIDRGGILGWPEEGFTRVAINGYRILEHRNFWTANPSLFRRSLTAVEWPVGRHSETRFAEALFRDTRAVAAFWGEGEPAIRHIGEVKAGVPSGYLSGSLHGGESHFVLAFGADLARPAGREPGVFIARAGARRRARDWAST